MKRYGIGIIGCGRISKKHIEAIVHNWEECDLVSVSDLFDERMDAALENYQKLVQSLRSQDKEAVLPDVSTISKTLDYKELLADPRVGVVAICTESGYHHRITLDALEAGKHVIVEKPMAMSNTDADEMILKAAEKALKLCVCHQNRFNPPIQRLRHVMDQKRFGKLIHGVASIRWNRNDGYYQQAPWRGTWELDGGTLMNQCIHNIDLLQWMMGPVQRVSAETDTFLRNIEGEDCGVAVLRFANGALGIIEGTACVYPTNLEETLSIFGEKGTVCIGGLAVNRIENWQFADEWGNEQLLHEEGADPDTVYGFGHIPLYKDMLDAINADREPLVHGAEGKKALEIVLAIYKSARTKQPVEFPLGAYATTTGVK